MRAFLLLPLLLALYTASAHAEGDTALAMPEPLARIWQAELAGGGVPFDAKLWAQSVADGKYDDAVHTWSAVEPLFPERLRPAAEATYLFLLWRQELPQTFVDRMLLDLGRESFTGSTAWAALSPAFASRLPDYLWTHAVLFGADQRLALARLPWTSTTTALKAWSVLRGGGATADALAHVASPNPWRHLLELSAALDLVRAGKIAEATQLLTAQVDSGLLAPAQQAALSLQIARLYFQRADMRNAEAWYVKVPVDSAWAPEAREELLWVWLRTGDTSRLRGTLLGLTRDDFKDHFLPELYVVRAISNLKLCHFDETRRDFSAFVLYNKAWATQIDAALASSTPPLPPNADWYTDLVARALKARRDERAKVELLAAASQTASLPAVGPQKHWLDAETALTGQIGRLERVAEVEAKRQWRANGAALTEAIRKLRFVRVELLTQLGAGATAQVGSTASAQAAAAANAAVEQDADGRWSFPLDGVDWSDEVFAARSAAHNVCL